MIGIKLQGRFGNQLFQYAYAYAVARKLNTSFYIDQTNQKFIIQQYFNTPSTWDIYYENIFLLINQYQNRLIKLLNTKIRNILYVNRVYNQINFPADVPFKEVSSKIKDNTIYEGYFLSEDFFIEYENEIRNFFTIKSPLKKKYQLKYKNLFCGKKIITVHIRKSDYLNLGHLNLGNNDLSIPLQYYYNVINTLQSENSLFLIISDDVKLMKKEFNWLENKYISNDTLINDFQHLLVADICILANSTFSWWGAWLNSNPQKRIYAPEHFMGHIIDKSWPENIYPDSWKLLNVNKIISNDKTYLESLSLNEN